ncbi:MAG: DUF1269 domain-containing protein [Phycisphaerae bacterium]|nr:DUF1269 domain-containing protein [Phycisphaerae bacterium]
MAESAHLWAIGFPDVHGAERFRDAVTSLAAPVQSLLLRDLRILVRDVDGSVTFDREPFPAAGNVLDGGRLGFLAGIALSAPLLTATAVGDVLGLAGRSISGAVKIDDQFIRDIQVMLRPGTSAVLMLDLVGDLQTTLEGLRGLGGTILKTNVDLARAELLQSTLRAVRT